jgi:tyrosine-protein kinase Etk/Wzc
MDDIKKKIELNQALLSSLDDKIDFREIFYILLSEKKIILGAVLATFLLGILYAFTIIPQYETNALLQVETKQPSLEMNLGALAPSNRQTSSSDVQMTLIKSRFIMVPVVEALGLDIKIQPHYLPLIGSKIARYHSSSLNKPFLGMNKYAWGGESLEFDKFNIGLKQGSFKLVAGSEGTYQFFNSQGQFLFSGKVGKLVHLNNAMLNGTILVKKLIANKGTEFSITKTSAENIADTIAANVQISDLGRSYQLEKTGVLQLSMTGTNPVDLVALLNTIANMAVKKDIERKSIEAQKTLEFLNNQLPVIKASLNLSENKLNRHHMKSGTIDLNVKSRMILKQLADVQREIEKVNISRIMLSQQFTPIHPYIIALGDKKVALQTELKELEKELQTLPATDQVVVGLMRDIKVKNQLYLMLLNKIQEMQFVQAGIISEVRILQLAHLPNGSLATGRFTILLTSILAGFIFGSLYILTRKIFKRFVEDPNWVEQHLGIPTFAIIPHSNTQKVNIQGRRENRESIQLLAHMDPCDLSIEALRSLRTSLQFALIGAKNNIISIMGISPGIGKSFISANFSHVLADSGKRVLLIDGDIRKGYLHSYFKGNRSPGLSELIGGQFLLEQVIQHTHLPGLDYIASGKFPPNPSELLMSAQFKEILDAVSLQYDLVIIDTAPILAVTDGVLIASYASVNFLVIANGVHHGEEVTLAVKRLQSNNVSVQGVIFNNIKEQKYVPGNYNYHYAYNVEKTEI